LVGERAPAFAAFWRDKQLEYSFRRALMQNYVDFSVCTRQAFEYTARHFDASPSAADRDHLLALYRTLPAFPDVAGGLARLPHAEVQPFAFSNGHPDDLESLLTTAGIRGHFADVVSLFNARTFKPNPAAYAYFHRAAQTGGAETWLISSNPFDVIGALAAGMKAVWLQRSPAAQFDPWEFQPTATAASLLEVADLFTAGGAR
jgi:2-haloacid dehalogenase